MSWFCCVSQSLISWTDVIGTWFCNFSLLYFLWQDARLVWYIRLCFECTGTIRVLIYVLQMQWPHADRECVPSVPLLPGWSCPLRYLNDSDWCCAIIYRRKRFRVAGVLDFKQSFEVWLCCLSCKSRLNARMPWKRQRGQRGCRWTPPCTRSWECWTKSITRANTTTAWTCWNPYGLLPSKFSGYKKTDTTFAFQTSHKAGLQL